MSIRKVRSFTKVTLITLNIAVAVFLIIGCYGKYLDPRKFWFTGLFVLAAFYFFLFVLSFIFFWLLTRPAWSLIGIATLLLCWKPLGELVQLRLVPNFIVEKHPANLRVMSWNVEHFDILEHKTHPERKMEMIEMINAYKPDIACFQEMVAGEKRGAINNLQTIMNQLGFPYYHYTYNPKLDFDDKHHFGLIIFSRYPLLHKYNLSSFPKDYNSIFQYADVVRNSDTIRVFNLHMQSLKFNGGNRSYIENPSLKGEDDLQKSRNIIQKLHTGFIKRSQQSERIRKVVDSTRYPVIVCGDFNDVPNSYAYHTIGNNLKNAFTERGTGIGRTFYSISPTLRIDHIFCDKRFSVEQFVRIRKKLSDHFPIIADLYYVNTRP